MDKPQVIFDSQKGHLSGTNVSGSVRRLRDLRGIYRDETAFLEMDRDRAAYEVEVHDSCGEVEGGLFFGISHVFPGKVGDEYFMTKGHFHEKRNRGEYYWGIRGTGLLLLMDEARNCKAERVHPGSLHYIGGCIAHRLVNTGNETLSVGACWPADAGHDYGSIAMKGFGVRVVERDGNPVLQEQ